MSCEICGGSNCSRLFHSIEEKEEFDRIAEPLKDRLRNDMKWKLDRTDTIEVEGEEYVRLSEVKIIIDI